MKVELFGIALWIAIIGGLVYAFGFVPVLITIALFIAWFMVYVV
jgi:hypothetical protein